MKRDWNVYQTSLLAENPLKFKPIEISSSVGLSVVPVLTQVLIIGNTPSYKTLVTLTFHTPVIDRGFCYKTKSIDVDPFPKHNVFVCCGGFHFALHFDIEDLERASGCKKNNCSHSQ